MTSARGTPLPTSERRQGRRRASDRQLVLLKGLVDWFADREPVPVIVLDRAARVVVCNQAARQFAIGSRLLSVDEGTFRFAARKPQAVIDSLAQGKVADQTLEVQFQRARFRIQFQSLALRAQPDLLVVTVHAAATAAEISDVVRESLRLTPAEAQIAARLYAGESLPDIARAREASVNTVKTQARYVFQKFGVKSRVELVRRLVEMISAHHGTPAAMAFSAD